MKPEVKELKAPWTWSWVGQSSFQGPGACSGQRSRWTSHGTSALGFTPTVSGSLRMLLLGKSPQALTCRSGAGSVEQKIPDGRRGPPATQGMGLCSARGALHAFRLRAEVKSSSCPTCRLSWWSCLVIWDFGGKLALTLVILVMNLHGDRGS